jgi:tight adherence protein B
MLFAMAAATTLLTYLFLTRHLDRRAAATAVRRLTRRPESPRATRGGPRIIQAAGEVRGRLTARLMEQFRMREAAARLLETAAVKWTAAGLLQRSTALFLAGFAVVTLLTGNRMVLAALGAAFALGSLPLAYLIRKSRRRVAAFEEQFPDCLEFISRSMRAGHALATGVEMVSREFSDPLASEFRRVFEEQNLGQPFDIVLRKLAQRVPSMDVQFFVSAVLLQKRTGGNLAELLDKLAGLIRERFKLRARIRAVSAQGLMSGRILSAIPMGVGVLMFLVNPQYARFFIDDPLGNQLLAAGLGLQVVGYLIIRKIVTFEV